MKKTALISGGLDGGALDFARALAKQGYAVAWCDIPEPAVMAPHLAPLKTEGAGVTYVSADIARREDRFQLLQEIQQRLGGPHLLVHLVTLPWDKFADPMEITEETFDLAARAHVYGAFFLAQSVARRMIELRETDPTFRGIIGFALPSDGSAAVSGAGHVILAGLRALAAQFAARLLRENIDVVELSATHPADAEIERMLRRCGLAPALPARGEG